MQRRFVSIWFRQLLADWQLIRRPELAEVPFVFAAPDHGRMMITAVNPLALRFGVEVGMRAADAKAICPGLEVLDDKPGRPKNLLRGLGECAFATLPLYPSTNLDWTDCCLTFQAVRICGAVSENT